MQSAVVFLVLARWWLHGVYTKDLPINDMDWARVFTLGDWDLTPTRYASPLRLLSQDLQRMIEVRKARFGGFKTTHTTTYT